MGGGKYICLLGLIIGASLLPSISNAARFNFPSPNNNLGQNVKSYLNSLPSSKWIELVNSGLDSINRQKRLEDNLLNSDITVKNGSLSHTQLLDTLPNTESKKDSEIAVKILKSSLFVYNSQCLPHDINEEQCRIYLEQKPLPERTSLRSDCQKLLNGNREGHHAYRRLLEPYYKDGFHRMFPETRSFPGPWYVSRALYDPDTTQNAQLVQSFEKLQLNLGFAQWAQFVEHDLSKPVSQSMSNGSPIECCSRDQNNLQPRHQHPACAPIIYQPSGKYDVPSCLNYVRSALAVADCNFGAAEQLNQATSSLDLSQLYGFTTAAQHKMRVFQDGLLKSTPSDFKNNALLPMTSDTKDVENSFCAWGASSNSTCFAAGDSRVNSSPFSIVIYTIFMRNHNRLARELKERKPRWSDERLYQAAKAVNVDIYRRVVMEEWLPEVLGQTQANEVLDTKPSRETPKEISNEFGAAAIRFYYSLLPNELRNRSSDNYNDLFEEHGQTNLFVLKNEIYKPHLEYTTHKLNEILESLLHQRAMQMDAAYAESVVWPKNTKPTHADILAFDIQRGRDHGVQPYYKYMEVCNGIDLVDDWSDFARFIPKETLDKLKTIYSSWKDVDLIVGGISETPVNGALGPTFNCVLAEQFRNVHLQHRRNPFHEHSSLLSEYLHFNGTKLLCLNSDLRSASQNIFKLPSASNLLVNCDDLV
ncbi:salivary peroxidase/catechol oxidase [Drosophila bipectinata]|uniref:salivary peroxidase/catechol oxidase n=1 Tax=Drosophila bipectinata TaxID=42026 RepID=UPI001C8A4A1A|nr:peroxidase [Drosophila bipectinata]